MKTIYFILLPLLLLALSGCQDYLVSVPMSSTVVENFYKTPEDAELALTGCYQTIVAAVVQGQWGRASFNTGMQTMLDAGTDECIIREGLSDPLFGTIGNGSYSAKDDLFKYNWAFLYTGISRTNFLLDKLDGIEMDSTRRVKMKAEARFLRGFYYMYVGMFYGGAPVYLNSNQNPLAERNSLKDVFTLVVNDFKYAYENLPHRAKIQGRANKWTSSGFMVKTYCYLASCKNNNVGADLNFTLNSFDWVNSTAFYEIARGVSEDIIYNSGYKLTEHYDYLFRETTDKAQYEECLFTAESTSQQAQGNDYGAWLFYLIPTGSTTLLGGGYGWFRPLGELYYNTYDTQDIRRKHNLTGSLNINSTEGVENIEGVNYFIPAQVPPTSESFGIGKFRYRDPKTKKISLALSEGNYPILRLADILLLNAEATYFTGDEELARQRLSDVRQRVSSDVVDGAPALSYLNQKYKKNDFVAELLQERSRELCFEAQRRNDLIRFGKLQEVIFSLSNGTTIGLKARWNAAVPILQENWSAAPYKIWYPIPLNDILLNKNLIQNPGYETR